MVCWFTARGQTRGCHYEFATRLPIYLLQKRTVLFALYNSLESAKLGKIG